MPNLALDFFLYALFSLILIVPAIYYRNHHAFIQRDLKISLNLSFVYILSAGLLLAQIDGINNGHDQWNCKFVAFFVLVPNIFFNFLRLYLLHVKSTINSAIDASHSNISSFLISHIGASWLLMSLLSFLTFTVGTIAFWFSDMCNPYEARILYYAGVAVLYGSVSGVTLLYFKEVNDQYLIKSEILTVSIAYVIFLVGMALAKAYTSIDIVTSKYLMAITILLNHNINLLCPLYTIYKFRSFKKKIESTISIVESIGEINKSKVKWERFGQVCCKFYVVENFKFMDWYYKDIHTLSHYIEAKAIYIANGAPFELNLDEENRNKVLQAATIPEYKNAFEKI